MLDTLFSSTFHFRMPHRCFDRFGSGDSLTSPPHVPLASTARLNAGSTHASTTKPNSAYDAEHVNLTSFGIPGEAYTE